MIVEFNGTDEHLNCWDKPTDLPSDGYSCTDDACYYSVSTMKAKGIGGS